MYPIFSLYGKIYCAVTKQFFIVGLFSVLQQDIDQGDFDSLAEVHATLSGLKAFATWNCADGIEECRKSCGGHGYLSVSSLPDLFTRVVPMCTFEGDNYVLVQQTARFQLKQLRKKRLHPLSSLPASLDYLHEFNTYPLQQCLIEDPLQWLDPLVQDEILRHRAIRLLVEVATDIENLQSQGISNADAWNQFQTEFIRVARAHCYLVLIRDLFSTIDNISDNQIRSVMLDVYNFFVLQHMDDTIDEFLEDGYMNGFHSKQIRQLLRDLCIRIRPNMVPLVDAFNFSDSSLWYSTLGRYDGQVYKALYESTQKAARNATDVTPAYAKYIRPLLRPCL